MKYYFIPHDKQCPIESFDHYYNRIVRRCIGLYYNDYPTHKHRTSGYVQIMELIPEKKILSTKYLSSNLYMFESMEFLKKDILKVDGHYYLLSFEKEYDTEIYKSFLNQ